MLHIEYSDCSSLTDQLQSPVPKQVEDERRSVEFAGLRQTLWEDGVLNHKAFAPSGDARHWIATPLQFASPNQ